MQNIASDIGLIKNTVYSMPWQHVNPTQNGVIGLSQGFQSSLNTPWKYIFKCGELNSIHYDFATIRYVVIFSNISIKLALLATPWIRLVPFKNQNLITFFCKFCILQGNVTLKFWFATLQRWSGSVLRLLDSTPNTDIS